MIQTKEDLRRYLEEDLAPFKYPWYITLFNRISQADYYYTKKYLKTLRHLEYYKNNKDKSMWFKIGYILYYIKWSRLSRQTGMNFYPNTIGKGLTLNHTISTKTGGTSKVKIGSYVTIRPGVLFGYKANNVRDTDDNPVVEDYVEFSPCARVFGKVHIGRGALIGVGAVPLVNVPPYAIVVGNPGKIIGFTKTPEEVVEFESDKYPEEERTPFDLLERNYKKYYLDRIKEIRSIMRVY